MDSTYRDLAQRIRLLAAQNLPRRTLVGIAGPPGCGKSTIANQVVQLLNGMTKKVEERDDIITAMAVGMDGFHYSRCQLDSFPNRDEAHLRRGAPWTFDVESMINFVQRLHESAQQLVENRQCVWAPSFDHALKDPIQDDIDIRPETSVVVLDGNYLLLDDGMWKEMSKLLDLKILVHIDSSVARERVAHRHVLSGIEPNLEMGRSRFDSNDGLNGELIRTKAIPCDLVVHSISA